MSVDKATVVRIAHLARIRVAEGDLDRLAGELNTILGFVEQLNEVNTDGVEPMASGVAGMALRRREDRVTDGDCRDKVLANAPAARDGYFVVPKVIE
jgi:aspartyl-tRNA(Asn)/glutamyl-tRNA(Gln) amidotransferase subunit C